MSVIVVLPDAAVIHCRGCVTEDQIFDYKFRTGVADESRPHAARLASQGNRPELSRGAMAELQVSGAGSAEGGRAGLGH